MSSVNWQPRIIAVGVDGSDQSRHAAAIAVEIARTHGATVTLIAVVRPPEGWWGVVGAPPTAGSIATALADAQQDVLDTTIAALDLEGVSLDTEAEIGEPAASLVDACHRLDADLLVVGRRGAGLMERLVMGSVADRVSRAAPCPVLIVP